MQGLLGRGISAAAQGVGGSPVVAGGDFAISLPWAKKSPLA